ncbi:MAG: hypothetical protein C4294_10400, partial [Nitrospiraceae bacterium]
MPDAAAKLLRLLRAMVALIVIAVPGCESRQDDPANRPSTAPARSERPVIELPEGSPLLTTIETESVVVRPLRIMLKAQSGKIMANENRLAHLSARVPGRIVAVYANLGDRVKTDDPLLLLDSPELGAAQRDYRKARTRLLLAEKAFERAKALLENQAIGTAEFQRREGDYQNAQAEVDEAEETLHLLGMSEQDITRLVRGKLPHAQVAQVPLRAPFTGEVIQRSATVGEVIDPTGTIFTIADLSALWVQADFPEQQASRLTVGLPIEVRVPAYPDEVFQGTVTYVGAVVDPATRTIMVRSEVPNPKGRLRPEMFADVRVMTDQQPVVSAPSAAIQQDGNQSVAFVVRGPRQFERREVTVGPASGEYVMVKAGLQEGEQVVTQGSYALKSEARRDRLPLGGPL